MDLSIINRNGGKVLLFEGHQYLKQKCYSNGNIIWFCCNRRKVLKCTGSITTHDEEVIKSVEHKVECKSDIAQNEVAMCVHKMKAKASISVKSMPKIYKKGITPVINKGLTLVTNVPSFNSIKHGLYLARLKKQQVKRTVFKNITEVEVPATFNDILLAEYRHENTVILLFSSEESKELLVNIKECFADGTFKVAPKPFLQLYLIMGDVDSTSEHTNVIPLFYALMTDKKQSSYLALFQLIRTNCPQLNPEKFHIDFEVGVSNSLKIIFPKIIIKKCYYHFCKSIWKKSKEIGLVLRTHRRIVGLCTALSLLPVDRVQEGWIYIQSQCENFNSKNLNEFMKYMEKTWIKNTGLIDEWCVFNERHRTNNVCENWNSQINTSVNKNHITLAKLLSALKDDTTTNKIKLNINKNKRTSRNRKRQYNNKYATSVNSWAN